MMMSLRGRILLLFVGVAVLPLLVLGVVESRRSQRALETMIAAQNERVAERAATAIRSRAALLSSDMLLLSENADTQRWLTSIAAGTPDTLAAADAQRFLRSAWERVSDAYSELSLLDTNNRELLRLTAPVDRGLRGAELPEPLALQVRHVESGRPMGTLSLQPLLNGLFPEDLLASGFGEHGYGMVLDRPSGRVLYHPTEAWRGESVKPLFSNGTWETELTALSAPQGTFRFRSGDSLRVASFVSLTDPAWTVIMSGAVDEFSAPFTTVRRWSLLLFLLVAIGGTLVFSQLLRRTTHSLEELTAATANVSRGDLSPTLPPAGPDEVGRLSASFGVMVHRVRDMLREVEVSRQMAVLGEFAAQLSHEVRNPLTSIKLNLQKLERQSREGLLPPASALPLELSLKEVERLDHVVRGVLRLTRTRAGNVEQVEVGTLVQAVAETVRAQAEAQGVTLELRGLETRGAVAVDRAQITGALLNLVLNALEAMPTGGLLRLQVARADSALLLRIADSGVGMDDATAAAAFRPFYTSRADGTGLGLPLAKRAIEEQGGLLTLARSVLGEGTEFVVSFPVTEPA